MYCYFSEPCVSHQSLLKPWAQQRNQRMSNGESSSSVFPRLQSGAVHTTSLHHADCPPDACKVLHFLGSGIGKDSHFLEQKKYCSILALVLKYGQESIPSASPHPGVGREHRWAWLVTPQSQSSSKAVGRECWVTFLMKHVAIYLSTREGSGRLFSKCVWS